MKKRGIMILYAVICGVLSAAAILTLLLTRSPKPGTAEEAVYATQMESVATELTIQREQESVTLTTTGDVWVLNGDASIPVNDSKAAALASAASHLRAGRALQDIGPLSAYGLDRPAVSVTASNPAGETAEIHIGSEVPGQASRYVLSGDTVYTVDADTASGFDVGLTDLLAWDCMPDILSSELDSLYIERGSFELELLYDDTGRYPAYESIFEWFVGRPFETPTAADTRKAHALFYDVTGLYIYGCAAFRPESLAAFGLEDPFFRTTVRYRDTGEDVHETTVAFGDVREDGFIYVRFDDSDQILLANASIAKQIAYTVPSDLLPRQICGILLDTVTRLHITAQAGEAVLEGDALHEKSFVRLYEALTAVVAAATAPDMTPQSDPVLTVEFERNTGHDSHMILQYYPYDDYHYLAVFNGRKNQLADRYELDAILDSLADYLQ